jgi:hypothetical protein
MGPFNSKPHIFLISFSFGVIFTGMDVPSGNLQYLFEMKECPKKLTSQHIKCLVIGMSTLGLLSPQCLAI